MLARLADRIAPHPRRTLAIAALVTVLAAAFGGPVFGALDASGGFTDEGAQSQRALDRVEQRTGRESSARVIVLLNLKAPVRSAAGQAQVRRAAGALRGVEGVAAVESAASTRDPRYVSRDGRSTYLAATLKAGASEDAVEAGLDDRFGDRRDVELGGDMLAQRQLGDAVSTDLGRAEAFAVPLLIVLTFLFFRGFRAATLPLVVGAATVFCTFLLLRGVNEVHGLSIFCLNLVIGLGLGLAIDYSLFLLTRYREELARHGPGTRAIRATMSSAGRTVAFSAATVAIALATLIVFPLKFLQSMAIGGALGALVAATVALVVVPAFFALWGDKLTARDRGGAHDRWARIARGVMSRPGPIAAVTAVVMLALAYPALHAGWTPVDIKMIPTSQTARQVGDTLSRDFRGQDSNPLTIVARTRTAPELRAFVERTRALPGIAAVAPPQRIGPGEYALTAVARGDVVGAAARGAVKAIRAGPTPVLVGGRAAAFIDQQSAIGSRLLLAVVLLAAFTFAVLWLMTGSVVLPAKALVMNALTVGVTLGVLKLVFQDGRLEGPLGYTANGGIEPTDFLVCATIVFALSTDYGVFLLGRIKEAHDEGLSNRDAVAVGLGRTGAVVSAAAVLLAIAIGAFVTSDVLFIKQVGIGAAFGVLVDALVVRALLVPSLMALLGPWNWWSPRPLARLHARIGLREEPAPSS